MKQGYYRLAAIALLASWLVALLFPAIAPLFSRPSESAIDIPGLCLAAGSAWVGVAMLRKGRAAFALALRRLVGFGLAALALATSLLTMAAAAFTDSAALRSALAFSILRLVTGILLYACLGLPGTLAALGLSTPDGPAGAERSRVRRVEPRKAGPIRRAFALINAIGGLYVAAILSALILPVFGSPSESMAPVLTAGDRFVAGYRFPFATAPGRGAIAIFANPRYPMNAKANFGGFFGPLAARAMAAADAVEKYLPDGSLKASPLVARLVGMPGEKLMMVDDILYSKRRGDANFRPVEADESWARRPAIDESGRKLLASWDSRKAAVDPPALASSIAASARALAAKPSRAQAEAFLAKLRATQAEAFKVISEDMLALANAGSTDGNPISSAGTRVDDIALALSVSTSPALKAELEAYAACPDSGAVIDGAYERSGRAISYLIKDNLLRRAAREAEMIASGSDIEALSADPILKTLTKEGGELDFYVNGQYAGLYDLRNFPEFPRGDAYLGAEQYFALGDNRYGSLDSRFATGNFTERAMDPLDPASIRYLSNVDPFALDLRFIQGAALFRIWPPARIGALR